MMDGMYIGLFAFLMSAALLVVGCHIGIYLEQHETSLDESQPTQAQTSNRDVGESHASLPTATVVSSVLQTQRWPNNLNEFRGFNSPRGRF